MPIIYWKARSPEEDTAQTSTECALSGTVSPQQDLSHRKLAAIIEISDTRHNGLKRSLRCPAKQWTPSLSKSRQIRLLVYDSISKFLGPHQRFDLAVESCVRHHLFGGFWFATCLFVFWVTGARPGEQKIRLRALTILCGSVIAVALTIFLGELYSWLPPSGNSALAHFYPALSWISLARH
jgi:hypothetical protein